MALVAEKTFALVYDVMLTIGGGLELELLDVALYDGDALLLVAFAFLPPMASRRSVDASALCKCLRGQLYA